MGLIEPINAPNKGMNLSQPPVCQHVTVITVQVMPGVSWKRKLTLGFGNVSKMDYTYIRDL